MSDFKCDPDVGGGGGGGGLFSKIYSSRFASLQISVFFFSVVRSEVPKESRHHLH